MSRTIRTNIAWRPYQLKVINSIIHGQKGEVHCILSPRQAGKTTVAENLILYYSINYKNSVSIFMEPTNKQCRKCFAELKKALECTSVFDKANESSLEIGLKNGSKVVFCSAEQSIAALQGYVCTGILIVDEAAYITDDIIYALQPMVQVHQCPFILASTPRFRFGLFYNYYVEGLKPNKNKIYSHDWSGETLLTPEKLEFYRRTLPANTFKNYYLGEFADFGTGVFGDFSKCISNDFNPTNIEYYFGCDWSSGQGQDETSITCFNSERQMIFVDHFNDKDETETVQHIADLVFQYNPKQILAESNSIGAIFIGLLRKELVRRGLSNPVKAFNTSNDSKLKLVSNLQVSFQNGTVQILKDEDLIKELNYYESALSPSGKVTYNAARGQHDDIIISTMLALKATEVGHYVLG